MPDLLMKVHVTWRMHGDSPVRTVQIMPKTMMAWERENPDNNAMVVLLNCRLVDVLWMLKHQEYPFETQTVDTFVDQISDLHLHVGDVPEDPLEQHLTVAGSTTSDPTPPSESLASLSLSESHLPS